MFKSKISRRDFLKMMGCSVLAASVGRLLDPLPPAIGQPKDVRGIASRVDPAADVLTQRNNNFRTGSYIQQGLNQSTFTSPNNWGKTGELSVEGAVYAQPLYTSNIFFSTDNRFHNAVFIATALNNVYAFDADTFNPTSILLWNLNLGNPDFSDNDDPRIRTLICAKLSPAGFDPSGKLIHGIGIQSTPVIDRNLHVIYVSYRIQDAFKNVHQRLAAIDIQTGTRVRDIEVIFPPSIDVFNHRQRASLLLVDGVIYVAFGSHCEDSLPENKFLYNGWVFAFDARSLRQVGIYRTVKYLTEMGGGAIEHLGLGGIWQASTGLTSDASGNIYFMTGNGAFTNDGQNLGDSFIRINPVITRNNSNEISSVSMEVTDWFTPYRQAWMNQRDLDLGSSGVLFIPGTSYIVGGGKQGIVYVLDSNNMGRMDISKEWSLQLSKEVADEGKAHTANQFPEDYTADQVIQKFQAGINQYYQAGSFIINSSTAVIPVKVTIFN